MHSFEDLVGIVARLRAPDGCPWDREQTHGSVARNITEEAAEAVDAIERHDLDSLCEELGDLLLQVLLQAQIAAEAGEFTLADVVDGIAAKLVRRHPHVFGAAAALGSSSLGPEERAAFEARVEAADDPEAVLRLWDELKLLERRQRPAASLASLLDSVPSALPALMQAQDVSRKAIAAGFDWGGLDDVWRQLDSELAEFQAEAPGSPGAADEFGDMLFTLANVALKEGIDAESALRSTVRRFRLRWAIMERLAQEAGSELTSLANDEQEALWRQAKQALADGGATSKGA